MLNLESVTEVTVDAVSLPEFYGDADTSLADLLRARAADLGEVIRRLETIIEEQHQHALATEDVEEMQRLQDADPFRWLADAKHSLQAGVMFAHRALSQPTGF